MKKFLRFYLINIKYIIKQEQNAKWNRNYQCDGKQSAF